MISPINSSMVNKNYFPQQQQTTTTVYSPALQVKEQEKGIVGSTMDTIGNMKKLYNTITKTIGGTVTAVSTALATGGGVMSLDWIIQKLSGNGVKEQSVFTTPFKTAWNLAAGTVKKVSKMFSKDTSFMKVVTYPLIGFPKDVFNYVKDAKGGSKAGKYVAVAVGLGAMVYSAYKTLICINKTNAEIDHEYKTGHNA